MNIIDKPRKNNDRSGLCVFLFIVVLVLSSLRLIYAFIYLKEDYHSDEIWSFGLSNSYFEPFIYQNADHSRITNFNEWFSSDIFKDYLTVQSGQRFSYDSVYYNQVHDYHPPLYYFIIHTISSFFPDKLYMSAGFVVNIICYLVTQFFLYKTVKVSTRNEIYSLAACILYGFSLGALNTYMFIRMYAMLSACSSCFIYYHAKLYRNPASRKFMLAICAFTVIGALVHHFFLPFAACSALCFCIWYLIKKKYKAFFQYALSLLGAAGVSLLIFPATIAHVFSGRTGDTKYTLDWQIKMSVNVVLREIFGLSISIVSNHSALAIFIIVGVSVVIAAPLVFLVRKETWFKKLIHSIKSFLSNLFLMLRSADLLIVTTVAGSSAAVLTTALTVSFIGMGDLADRYIFFIYPCVCVATIIFVQYIVKWTKLIKYKWLACLISISFCILSNINMECGYFFEKSSDAVSGTDIICDSNCVFVTSEEWMMTCFSKYAMNADLIYAVHSDGILNKLCEIVSPTDADKPFYYFVDETTFKPEESVNEVLHVMPSRGMSEDVSDYPEKETFEMALLSKYNYCEYIGFDEMFGRKYEIYKVK